MVYEVTDNRIKIGDYFFEMDTENNIYVYGKGLKFLDKIEIVKPISFDLFKQYCNKWILDKES